MLPRDPGARRNEDVGRLDVAMHQPLRVRGVERARHLPEYVERAVRRESALVRDQRLQIDPLDVAHRDVEHALGLTRLEDRHDAGVVEPGGRPPLLLEALAVERVVRELGCEHFEGDLAPVAAAAPRGRRRPCRRGRARARCGSRPARCRRGDRPGRSSDSSSTEAGHAPVGVPSAADGDNARRRPRRAPPGPRRAGRAARGRASTRRSRARGRGRTRPSAGSPPCSPQMPSLISGFGAACALDRDPHEVADAGDGRASRTGSPSGCGRRGSASGTCPRRRPARTRARSG